MPTAEVASTPRGGGYTPLWIPYPPMPYHPDTLSPLPYILYPLDTLPPPPKGHGTRDALQLPRKGPGTSDTYPPHSKDRHISFPQLRWR